MNTAQYQWRKQDCPVCNTPPSRFIGYRGGKSHRQGLGTECEIWRCECGLIFPNPMPIPTGDDHYREKPEDYFNQHDETIKFDHANAILLEIERITGRRGRLLDVGAGRGEMLKAAIMRGWDATGIEPTPAFAEYARRASGANVLNTTLEESGLASESFDAVILGAVLEHLYNPNEIIGIIAGLLQSGGVLFVDVPNEGGLYFRIGNLYHRLRGRRWSVNLAPTFSPYHVFGFTPKSLDALLVKHGLNPVIFYTFSGKIIISNSSVLERAAASVITKLGRYGHLGDYLQAWAIKV